MLKGSLPKQFRNDVGNKSYQKECQRTEMINIITFIYALQKFLNNISSIYNKSVR